MLSENSCLAQYFAKVDLNSCRKMFLLKSARIDFWRNCTTNENISFMWITKMIKKSLRIRIIECYSLLIKVLCTYSHKFCPWIDVDEKKRINKWSNYNGNNENNNGFHCFFLNLCNITVCVAAHVDNENILKHFTKVKKVKNLVFALWIPLVQKVHISSQWWTHLMYRLTTSQYKNRTIRGCSANK